MAQSAQAVAPTRGVACPAAHGKHAGWPASGWNVFKSQGAQEVEPTEAALEPAAQGSQKVLPSAPAKLPAAHEAQEVAPALPEKVPAAQGAHAALPPCACAEPAAHSVQEAAPGALKLPAEQVKQAVEPPPGAPHGAGKDSAERASMRATLAAFTTNSFSNAA